MTRVLPLAVGVALLAGCGGGGADPHAVLSQTAAKLGQLESADSFHFTLLVEPREGDPFGFELDGPFAFCRDGADLPTLDVEYTQIAGGDEATVRVVSTGEQAFVEVGNEAYELDGEQEAELASTCRELGGEGGGGSLQTFRVDDWVVDPEASFGDEVDTVEGDLDVVAVVNDLVELVGAFGGARLAKLDRDDAQRIADATEESTFELETGHEDRFLRRLLLSAELGFDVREELRDALGDVVGATITIEVELDGPNERVVVDAPPNARPAGELPGG